MLRDTDVGKAHFAVKAVLAALIYGVGYTMLRHVSLDQWYLPAGLRFAALLFLPYRYWPFLWAGEVGALAVMRYNMTPFYGWAWYVADSVLLMPTAMLVAHAVRYRARLTSDGVLSMTSILVGAAAVATLITLVNFGCIWLFMEPYALHHGPAKLHEQVVAQYGRGLAFGLGDYMGALLVCPIVIAWQERRSAGPLTQQFRNDVVRSLALIAGIALSIKLMHSTNMQMVQTMRLVMLLPALFLTIVHGFRGASFGLAAASLGVGLTMGTGGAGYADDYAILVQEVLALVGTCLLAFGTLLSNYFRNAKALGLAAQEAMSLARDGYFVSERHLREKALQVANSHAILEMSRRPVVAWLRENGYSAAAMGLTKSGIEESRLFHEHVVAALYPLAIERDGLFNALQASTITDRLIRGNVDVRYRLRGNPNMLSTELQLATYRAVGEAITILAHKNPSRIVIGIKCGMRLGYAGALIKVTAAGCNDQPEEAPDCALLAARVKAFGGILHAEPDEMSVLIVEQKAAAELSVQPPPLGVKYNFLRAVP